VHPEGSSASVLQSRVLNLSGNKIELLPDEIGLLTILKTLNPENNELRSSPVSIIYLISLRSSEFRRIQT